MLHFKLPPKNYKWMTITNWDEPAIVNVESSPISFPRVGDRLVTNQFPVKFDDNRKVAPCHGMTIICPLSKDSSLYIIAEKLMQYITRSPHLSPYYGVLAPSSLHMTVADLTFSKDLEQVKANYSVLHKHLSHILSSSGWTQFTMKITRLRVGMGISFALDPYSKAVKNGLDNWRNEVYNSVGDICSKQVNYQFHVTLAYQVYSPRNDFHTLAVQELTEYAESLISTIGPITFGNPTLSAFSHMNAFPPYKK